MLRLTESHTSLVSLGEEGCRRRGLTLGPHGSWPGHQVLGLHHLHLLLLLLVDEVLIRGLGEGPVVAHGRPISGDAVKGRVL